MGRAPLLGAVEAEKGDTCPCLCACVCVRETMVPGRLLLHLERCHLSKPPPFHNNEQRVQPFLVIEASRLRRPLMTMGICAAQLFRLLRTKCRFIKQVVL